jgi:hypothetical protein
LDLTFATDMALPGTWMKGARTTGNLND